MWGSIELTTSGIVIPLSLLAFRGPLACSSPIPQVRRLWVHLKGAKIVFEVTLRSRCRRCEEELGCEWLRAHVVDFAHVDEESLGEDRNDDNVCPEESVLLNDRESITVDGHVQKSKAQH